MPDDLTRVIAEATEGKDREGTARWPECCRDTYSLAIEEVAAALAPVIEARVREAHRQGYDAAMRNVLSREKALANAWDEGFGAGISEANEHWRDHSLPRRRFNPYRAEEVHRA